jgi:DNA-binding NarL/FixJ family response regulator
MSTSGEIAREAYARRDWRRAFEELAAADASGTLAPADVERYAFVAALTGREDESTRLLERTHQLYEADGDVSGAARSAFWLALGHIERGEMAQGGGWLARAQRILEATDVDCAERGYVHIPEGLQLLEGGEFDAALELFEAIADIGERFGDRDLRALGWLGRGQALALRGDTTEGASLLDEAMVSVTTGEVSAMVAGIVYCAVIETCQRMYDLRRAQEWTTALHAWCEAQPDLVPFRGRCLVYRAEIMRLSGAWADAVEEVDRASAQLSDPPTPAIGEAYYLQGELHRLRGAFSDADDAYRRAAEHGRRTEPGLALLRLALGRIDAAATAIGHALNEASGVLERSELLISAVDIHLAAGAIDAARNASEELSDAAEQIDAPLLIASARRATAAVELATGHAAAALRMLRESLDRWQQLDVPYETARTRRLLGEAARALGDHATAEVELAAARSTFERLGAVYELSRLGGAAAADAVGLTPRELQVLELVATGMTNRAIANSLTISEKTVARHLSNIFGKIGVSSRAAATAYAYEHGII